MQQVGGNSLQWDSWVTVNCYTIQMGESKQYVNGSVMEFLQGFIDCRPPAELQTENQQIQSKY